MKKWLFGFCIAYYSGFAFIIGYYDFTHRSVDRILDKSFEYVESKGYSYYGYLDDYGSLIKGGCVIVCVRDKQGQYYHLKVELHNNKVEIVGKKKVEKSE